MWKYCARNQWVLYGTVPASARTCWQLGNVSHTPPSNIDWLSIDSWRHHRRTTDLTQMQRDSRVCICITRPRDKHLSHAMVNRCDGTGNSQASYQGSGVASYGALGYVPPSTSSNFILSSLWSKSESQLSKYCVVCEISWCKCQQLTALLISTALVTKLLVIKQLLHPALKFTVSVPSLPWPIFQLCSSSQ